MSKTRQPFRVFLSFDYVRPRGADIQGRVFMRAKWVTRGTGVVMYKSKVCAALNGDDAQAAASKLARAWLAKQNERPRMSQNVLAAMEWDGPRYVDTTGEV